MEWALIVTVHMGFLTSNSTPTYFPSQEACEVQAAQINAPLADQTISTAGGSSGGDKKRAFSLQLAARRRRNSHRKNKIITAQGSQAFPTRHSLKTKRLFLSK